MEQKKILVVEDEAAIREMLKNLLEIEGYTVVTAANGREGVDSLMTGQPPSLILLDMMMPRYNGWYLLDYLRANPSLADIPTVIVSAYRDTAQSVKPRAFVSKPVQWQELLDTVRTCAA